MSRWQPFSLTLALLVGLHVVAAESATEPGLTTATTTVTVVTPETPLATLYPRDSPVYVTPVYAPEPKFPLMDLVVECFAHLSLPCAQKKMVVYLDQLSRAKRISIFGDLLELVKIRLDTVPPITEEVLSARKIEDQDSLSRLLEMVTDRFMDSHVLRLNLPLIENGKVVSSPVDINFVDVSENSREGRDMKGHGKGGKGKKKGSKKSKKHGKKMMKMFMAVGKKMVEMMGKMIMVKMMMMFPIAMKKSMIGGMAGMMSMGIMKFMMAKKLFDMVKNKLSSCKGGGGFGGGDFLGGGGGCGGGGGGYDRSENGWDRAHDPDGNTNYNTNTYTNSQISSNNPYYYYYNRNNQNRLK